MQHQMIPHPGMTHFPPPVAVMNMLARHSREQLEGFIEIAIGMLDLTDGDTDREEGGDDEPVSAEGDTGDRAWVEWPTMRGSQKSGPNIVAGHEDDELDDPAESDGDDADTDNAEDELATGATLRFAHRGPGCPISDPDSEHDGCENEDADL